MVRTMGPHSKFPRAAPALLAAAILAAAGCGGAGAPAPSPIQPPQDGDAVVSGARFLATEGPEVRYRLTADRGVYRDADRTVALSDVFATIYATETRVYTVRAGQGRIDVDTSDMTFPGAVVATTSDGAALAGTDFRYEAAQELIRSDRSITVIRDQLRVRGEGFRAWPREERFELLGGVSGQVNRP